MTAMVNQPPGGSDRGVRYGGGYGGVRSKVPLNSKWKVGDKQPYNGNTLRKCKHCGKIDSLADDECFDFKKHTHTTADVLETRKAQMTRGGVNKYIGEGKATHKSSQLKCQLQLPGS